MSKPLTVTWRDDPVWQTVPVHILGPNLIGQAQTFHVHAGGCADVQRSRLYASRDHRVDREGTVEVTCLRDVVTGVYVPEEHEYDEVDWRDYADEFRVFPCLVLPDLPTPVDQPLHVELDREQVWALLRYGAIVAGAVDSTHVRLTVTEP